MNQERITIILNEFHCDLSTHYSRVLAFVLSECAYFSNEWMSPNVWALVTFWNQCKGIQVLLPEMLGFVSKRKQRFPTSLWGKARLPNENKHSPTKHILLQLEEKVNLFLHLVLAEYYFLFRCGYRKQLH
jgi:hypothetical protein